MTSRDLWPCIAAMLMSDALEPTLQRRSGPTEAEWVLAFFRAVMGKLESMWEQTKAGVRPHEPPRPPPSRLSNAFAAQINLPNRVSSTMPTLDSLLHPRSGPIHPSLSAANGTNTAQPVVSDPKPQSAPRGSSKTKAPRPSGIIPPTSAASSSSSSQHAFTQRTQQASNTLRTLTTSTAPSVSPVDHMGGMDDHIDYPTDNYYRRPETEYRSTPPVAAPEPSRVPVRTPVARPPASGSSSNHFGPASASSQSVNGQGPQTQAQRGQGTVSEPPRRWVTPTDARRRSSQDRPGRQGQPGASGTNGATSQIPPMHVDPRNLRLPQVPPPPPPRAQPTPPAPAQTSAAPQRPAETPVQQQQQQQQLPTSTAVAVPPVAAQPVADAGVSAEVPVVLDFEHLVTSELLPLPEPGTADIPSSSSALEYYARRCQELRMAARSIMSGQPGRTLTIDEKIFWNKLGTFVLGILAEDSVAILKKNPKIVIPGVDQFKNAAPSGTDGKRPRGRPPKPPEYDADGNLIPRKIKKRTLCFDENGNVIKWKKKPKLDADGNVIPPRPRGRPRIVPQYGADGNLIPPPIKPPVFDEHGNVIPRRKPGPKPKPPQYDAEGNLIPPKAKKSPLLDEYGNVISRRGARYDADGNILPPKAKKTPLLDADGNPLPRRGPGRPPKPPQYDADGNLIPPTAKPPPRLDEHGNPIPPKKRVSREPQLDADGNPLPSQTQSQKRKANEPRLDEHGNPIPAAKRTRTLDLASLAPFRQRPGFFGPSRMHSSKMFSGRGRPAKTPLSFQRRDIPREMTSTTVNVALMGDQETPRKVIDLSTQSSQAKIRAQDRRADADRRENATWSPLPHKRPGRPSASAAAGSSSAIPDYAAKTPGMPRRRLLPFVELPSSQRPQKAYWSPPPSPTLAAARKRSGAGQRATSRIKPSVKQMPQRAASSRTSRAFRRRMHYRSTRSARQVATAAKSRQAHRGSRSRARLDSEPIFALSPDTEESDYEPSASETEDDGEPSRHQRRVPVVVIPQSRARRQFLIERGGYGECFPADKLTPDPERDDYRKPPPRTKRRRRAAVQQAVLLQPEPLPQRFLLPSGRAPDIPEDAQHVLQKETLLRRLEHLSCGWNDCDAILASEWHLQRHVKQHVDDGKQGADDPLPGISYSCLWDDCYGGHYATSAQLFQHLLAVHVSPNLSCPYCDRVSPNIWHLARVSHSPEYAADGEACDYAA